MIGFRKEVTPAQVILMPALSTYLTATISDTWIHICLIFYSWNALCRKEVLTHRLPAPSSCALWEGGRISRQYLQWPFPLTGQRPMGKTGEDKQWTIGFRDEQWYQLSMCHKGYIGLGGLTNRIKTSAVSQEHLGHLLRNCALFKVVIQRLYHWDEGQIFPSSLLYVDVYVDKQPLCCISICANSQVPFDLQLPHYPV